MNERFKGKRVHVSGGAGFQPPHAKGEIEPSKDAHLTTNSLAG
jgi:hypothetical protein